MSRRESGHDCSPGSSDVTSLMAPDQCGIGHQGLTRVWIGAVVGWIVRAAAGGCASAVVVRAVEPAWLG